MARPRKWHWCPTCGKFTLLDDRQRCIVCNTVLRGTQGVRLTDHHTKKRKLELKESNL